MLGDHQDYRIKDCPQSATLKAHGDLMQYYGEILARLERHSERQTEALEDIAKQGAMVINHEKRLDRVDISFDMAFQKIRTVDSRVREIELKNAEETGVGKVADEKKKFTSALKIELVTPALVLIFFIFWTFDKFGFFVWIAQLAREMKG
jgi:hypothetical protein